jgi:excisionase family DNA binding protein
MVPWPVTFVTISVMKKQPTHFDYPITIKKHLDFFVFSVPDLGITIVEDLPPGGRFTPVYLLKLAKTLGRTWIKIGQRLQQFNEAEKKPPRPSRQRTVLDERVRTLMTATELANRLGVSRMSVHRLCEKGLLEYEETSGGHRRFSELQLKKYLACISSGCAQVFREQ